VNGNGEDFRSTFINHPNMKTAKERAKEAEAVAPRQSLKAHHIRGKMPDDFRK
jgi:hypothetical protein